MSSLKNEVLLHFVFLIAFFWEYFFHIIIKTIIIIIKTIINFIKTIII